MKRPDVAARVAAKNRGKKRPDVSAWRIKAFADGTLKPHVMTMAHRQQASERMKANNPMKRADVAAKVRSTSIASGAYARRGEATSLYWSANPQFRASVVHRMKTRNPMWNADVKERSLSKTRTHLSPSKLELWFSEFCKRLDLPVWYTGTGEFWVKARNPDFKIHGLPLLIEVTDGYNRTPAGRKVSTYAIPTIEHYEKHGFACLVVMLPSRVAHRTEAVQASLKRAIDRFIQTRWSQVWSPSLYSELTEKTA